MIAFDERSAIVPAGLLSRRFVIELKLEMSNANRNGLQVHRLHQRI